MITRSKELAAFSPLLERGAVVHWTDNFLSFSAPDGVSFADILHGAGIECDTFSQALANRVAREQNTCPVVAAGPLTPSQERLMRSIQILSDVPFQIRPTTILIQGPLDPARLETAMNRTVGRYAALRAQVRLRTDRVFVQVISAARAMPLHIIDLSAAPDPESALWEEIARLTAIPFNATSAFFRAQLLKLSDTRWCLAVSIHHMVSDVWSVGLFYEALSDEYRNPSRGIELFHMAPHAYFQVIKKIQSRRGNEEGLRSLDYWCSELALPQRPLRWIGQKSEISAISLRMADHQFAIDHAEIDTCKAYSMVAGITLAQQLLAAWCLTLRLFTETDDIRIGVMAACRTSPDIETEIGFFSNPVVVRADFKAYQSVTDVVESIQKKLNSALVHQETPIQDIADRLSQDPDFDLLRLYQTMFALNNVPTTELELDGLPCREINPSIADIHGEMSTIDVRLSLTPTRDGLRAMLTYKVEIMSKKRIEEMAACFCRCLQALRTYGTTEWSNLQ